MQINEGKKGEWWERTQRGKIDWQEKKGKKIRRKHTKKKMERKWRIKGGVMRESREKEKMMDGRGKETEKKEKTLKGKGMTNEGSND